MAMQYAQEMQQKMMQGGGPTSMTPKLVTNIPNTNYNPMKSGGGTLNGNIKFDDILISSFDKIIDLQMKPSFAELIREMAPSVMERKSGIILRIDQNLIIFQISANRFSSILKIPKLNSIT